MFGVEVLKLWEAERFRAMGTQAHIVVFGGSFGLLLWAREELSRLEALWSRFQPRSDVSRLNAAGGRAIVVAEETAALIDIAQQLWQASGGLFDPSVLPALERAGYRCSFEAMGVPEARPLHHLPSPGCSAIEVSLDLSVVQLPRAVRIDLGGLGKGRAADLIATGLVERGAAGACVSIGGDVRCCGTGPCNGAWNIEVESPFDGDTLYTQQLTDGAVVMSTTVFRRWRDTAGHLRHHLIDPRTGMPSASGIDAVAATAPTACWAEGVAKACLIAGADVGRQLAQRLGVDCTFLGDNGRQLTARIEECYVI